MLAPEDRELHIRCDEVLHYLWDPIGVAEIVEARDEYVAYVPGVLAILAEGGDAECVADFLVEIETERMELPANRVRALEVARILVTWAARVRR